MENGVICMHEYFLLDICQWIVTSMSKKKKPEDTFGLRIE